jgi:CBS domain-containing protein
MSELGLVPCPACGHPNIPGVDECEECSSPLSHLSKPKAQAQLPIERSIHQVRIRALNPRPPLTVPPHAAVSDVLKLLVQHGVGCVVVTDGDGRPVGIFSERDALMRLGVDYAARLQQPISQYMTPAVETLELDDKLAFALHKMDLGGFRHIPVTAGGVVVGVISVRDLLRHVTDELLSAEA